jgi:hypothetical protein
MKSVLPINNTQLSFECSGTCKKKYFANTDHYVCKTCPLFYCIPCGTKALKYIGHGDLCDFGHPLKKLLTTPTLIGV